MSKASNKSTPVTTASIDPVTSGGAAPAVVAVLSLAELRQQQEEIAARIAAATADAQAKALETIKTAMEGAGLTVAQVAAHFPKLTKGTTGQTVAPKYRSADGAFTWSGRGLQPKWLSAAIAGGAKLEQFAITTTH